MTKKQVNFGIIGFGIFGEKRLIPGFQGSDLGNLIAISKTSKDAALQKAKEYGISEENAYDSVPELLKNDEIEAVFIATPNNLHKKHTIMAAEAGKNIILEKPMAMNAKECEEMLSACEHQGVKFMIAHCMRYNSSVLKLKELIEDGSVGDLVALNANFYYNGSYSTRDWLFNKNIAGGGPIADLGVHLIDTMRFQTKKEVKNLKFQMIPSEKGNVEEKALMNLAFEDNIMGSIGVGFKGNYYTSFEIIGTKCTLQIPFFNRINRKVPLYIYKDLKIEQETISNQNCYSAEIEAFAKSILEDSEVPIPAEEGLKNQRLLDMMLWK